MSEGWISLRLGDHIAELPKSALAAACAQDGGAFAFYCSSSEPKATGVWMQDQPAILLGTGGVASVHLGKGRYSYSTDTWAIRIKESSRLIQPFAFRILEHVIASIDYAGFEGSGLRHLRKPFIRDFRFLAPRDLEVQRYMVSILDAVDSAIGSATSQIVKYQQVRAGLMQDLFTRGVVPDGKLRSLRRDSPALYGWTEVGWLPVDWSVSGLAAKARSGSSWIRTGPFGSSLKGEHWKSQGHPVITIGALGEGKFTESELLFVGARDAARLIDFQLQPDDVVFSRVADVGRSVVVRAAQSGWIMSSNLMRIAVDASKARPDYLQLMLAHDSRVKAQIRARVNSGGRDVANSSVLSELRFAWPPVEEQDRIIARAAQLSTVVGMEEQRRDKLRFQKAGLMQELLSGKAEVKPRVIEAVHA